MLSEMKQDKMDFGKGSILKLLIKLSVPAVLAMMINAIYNIVDRIFIGRYIGEEALAGATVDFPVVLGLFALASMVEVGAGSHISRYLGKDHKIKAAEYFGNGLSLSLLISTVFVIAIYINMDSFLSMLGAEGSVFIYAKNYLKIVLIGINFQAITVVLGTVARIEGKPLLAMKSMVTAALINIVLDYIFIRYMKLGVEGAALATIIGQAIGMIIISSYYLRGKSRIKISGSDLIPSFKTDLSILSVGVASFISIFGTSVSMYFLTHQLLKYGDTQAVTALGVINSLYAVFIMPIMGVQQGMQPLLGYNYGAGNMKRVFATLKWGLIVAVSFSILVFGILESFPEPFIQLFIHKGSNTMEVTKAGLRIFIFMLPLLSVNFFGIVLFQSMGRGKTSTLLSVLRQFVFLVPWVIILPRFYGLNGVWLATPIADGMAILFIGGAIIYERKIQLRQDS